MTLFFCCTVAVSIFGFYKSAINMQHDSLHMNVGRTQRLTLCEVVYHVLQPHYARRGLSFPRNDVHIFS